MTTATTLSAALSDARAGICRCLVGEHSDAHGTPGTPGYDRMFRLLIEMRSIQFDLDVIGGGAARYDLLASAVSEEIDEARANADEERRRRTPRNQFVTAEAGR